jgi:hypothetical protein
MCNPATHCRFQGALLIHATCISAITKSSFWVSSCYTPPLPVTFSCSSKILCDAEETYVHAGDGELVLSKAASILYTASFSDTMDWMNLFKASAKPRERGRENPLFFSDHKLAVKERKAELAQNVVKRPGAARKKKAALRFAYGEGYAAGKKECLEHIGSLLRGLSSKDLKAHMQKLSGDVCEQAVSAECIVALLDKKIGHGRDHMPAKYDRMESSDSV